MIFKRERPRPWLDGYSAEEIEGMSRSTYKAIYERSKRRKKRTGPMRRGRLRKLGPWVAGMTQDEVEAIPKAEYVRMWNAWRYLTKKERAKIGKKIMDDVTRRKLIIAANRLENRRKAIMTARIKKLAMMPVGDRFIETINRYLGVQ